jgi:apolipoprotein N-acyltransferase
MAWMAVAIVAFTLAYTFPAAAPLVAVYLFALVQISRAPRWRLAFYPALGAGLAISAINLTFFWKLFSFGAMALWFVLALWLGLFAVFARLTLNRFGRVGWLLVPLVWMGFEYFRSELYPLKFSWVNPGFAFAWLPNVGLYGTGVYGCGLLLMAGAVLAAMFWNRSKLRSAAILVGFTAALILFPVLFPPTPGTKVFPKVQMSGLQMEFPAENEVLVRLTELMRTRPKTELVILSEYVFDGPVPPRVLNWCRKYKVYLVAGGKDPAPGGNFYNTAYVVSPEGEVVFRQVKCVPIQFFKDGLPAERQQVWNSPWGKLGICICYDLSYSRVTDELIRQGAQALIVPTMDVADWGERQHLLHARVAPTRAAEYGIPVFRLASSGISQFVDAQGKVRASAPFDASGAVLNAAVPMGPAGVLPIDRFLVPVALGITIVLLGFFLLGALGQSWNWPQRRPQEGSTPNQMGHTTNLEKQTA